MQQENILTANLVAQLQNGGLRKLTRLQKTANYRRELGDSSFRADIFITFSEEGVECKFDSRSTQFIAIEVKVKDWKEGLYQAWRYNAFAEKSYLALFKPYAKNINIELFRQYNVGLIIFDETSIEVLNAPKNNKFSPKTYSAELRGRLWSRLSAVKSV